MHPILSVWKHESRNDIQEVLVYIYSDLASLIARNQSTHE